MNKEDFLKDVCSKHNWNLEKAAADLDLWFGFGGSSFTEWYETTLRMEGDEAFCD